MVEVIETGRARFVELFTDEAFTVFSDGAHDIESANLRFDRMLSLVDLVPYAKQPVIVRTTSRIVGYTGVGTFLINGMDRLEWGWGLAPDARGQGYATEATTALLARADAHEDGELLCIIAAGNVASRRVADKVGFRWRRRIDWMGDPSDPVDLLERTVGSGGPPLLAPTPPDRDPPSRRARAHHPTPCARGVLAPAQSSAVLLIDAANVVGSRPTGWWRDRPGAARELVARVRRAAMEGTLSRPVVLVLEGQAKKGAEEGAADGVEVVHAPGSGDDALVALAADSNEPVVVVSADRDLAGRVRRRGAKVVGPSWLLRRLGP